MRIVAGIYGGRVIQSPSGHRTHPMSERMRGALFNSLGILNGFKVLDAFAGSGALSIEALSRGADQVVAIDVDKQAIRCVDENKTILQIGQNFTVVRAQITGWLEHNPEEVFDIVLCDPPYEDIKLAQILALAMHVRSGGILVLSCPKNFMRPEMSDFSIEKDKSYAEGRLVFYRKT